MSKPRRRARARENAVPPTSIACRGQYIEVLGVVIVVLHRNLVPRIRISYRTKTRLANLRDDRIHIRLRLKHQRIAIGPIDPLGMFDVHNGRDRIAHRRIKTRFGVETLVRIPRTWSRTAIHGPRRRALNTAAARTTAATTAATAAAAHAARATAATAARTAHTAHTARDATAGATHSAFPSAARRAARTRRTR